MVVKLIIDVGRSDLDSWGARARVTTRNVA